LTILTSAYRQSRESPSSAFNAIAGKREANQLQQQHGRQTEMDESYV
jgi:hypothetical protein